VGVGQKSPKSDVATLICVSDPHLIAHHEPREVRWTVFSAIAVAVAAAAAAPAVDVVDVTVPRDVPTVALPADLDGNVALGGALYLGLGPNHSGQVLGRRKKTSGD